LVTPALVTLAVGVLQTPALQVPLLQVLLHMPQCWAFVAMSAQLAPHRVWPGAHEVEHMPLVQTCPAAHSMLHPPQWLASARVLTHCPVPQSCKPVAQPVGPVVLALPGGSASLPQAAAMISSVPVRKAHFAVTCPTRLRRAAVGVFALACLKGT
jgi:hypothetical protein